MQRYFHLEQPTCLGFNNVRKGLTKQQTNSGIKIALKCSCSLSSFAGSCFLVSSFFPCRFTKNLSPDKINLSTLKGQGQLTNLELDEEVLQNVLELPTWLAITRVYCNKASIRVSWGNLKSWSYPFTGRITELVHGLALHTLNSYNSSSLCFFFLWFFSCYKLSDCTWC